MGDWAPVDWRRARDAGKFTKAHAGEFCGAEFVRYAVEKLGAQRIQHGVRAIEDPNLVERLVRDRIPLTVCPLSNVRLRVFPSMTDHTLKRLLDAGVRVTIVARVMLFCRRLISPKKSPMLSWATSS